MKKTKMSNATSALVSTIPLNMALPPPVPLRRKTSDTSAVKLGFSRYGIRLTGKGIRGHLFGFGELVLDSNPEDYGEMSVYANSGSSGKMSTAKAKT